MVTDLLDNFEDNLETQIYSSRRNLGFENIREIFEHMAD
jgi:hypothetical protein